MVVCLVFCCFICLLFVSFFFFKQKTAYEMRISDWSSDVCSSDLPRVMSLVVFTGLAGLVAAPDSIHPLLGFVAVLCIALAAGAAGALNQWWEAEDRKSTRLNSSH